MVGSVRKVANRLGSYGENNFPALVKEEVEATIATTQKSLDAIRAAISALEKPSV